MNTCFVRTQEIDVIRITEGELDLDTGRYSAAEEELFSIEGNIQPTSGKTLERLPEGRRHRVQWTLYTTTALEVGTQVFFKGARYEIDFVADWSQDSSVLPHYQYAMLICGNRGHDVEGINA